MVMVLQIMSWHQTTAVNILKHIPTVIPMVWTMATWLLQLQKATITTVILISHIALRWCYIKRNSTIYFKGVRLEMNSFRLWKGYASTGFSWRILGKEMNLLGEYPEISITKTLSRGRNSDVCNKEKKSAVTGTVLNLLMFVTRNLLFHINYSHKEFSSSSNAVKKCSL